MEDHEMSRKFEWRYIARIHMRKFGQQSSHDAGNRLIIGFQKQVKMVGDQRPGIAGRDALFVKQRPAVLQSGFDPYCP